MRNKYLTIFCLLLPLLLVALPAVAVEIILPESVNPSITYMDAPFNNDPNVNGTSAYVVWIALGTVGGSGIVGLMVFFWRGLRRKLQPGKPYRPYYVQRRAVIDCNNYRQRRVTTRRMGRRRSILSWVW